jgi:hypothetical protein
MPISFVDAWKIVCPDGREVVPYSKDFNDIFELMKQSGHTEFQDNLVVESVPKQPMTVEEAKPYIERKVVDKAVQFVSKRQWLSVDTNKQNFLKVLNSKK